MTIENQPAEVEPAVVEEKVEPGAEYGLHIRLAREMQPVLKDSAELYSQ